MLKALIASAVITALGFASPINWGLGYNGKDAPPTPPPGSHVLLQEHNGLYKQDTEEKRVFFTFDLGYEAGHTADVLDILKVNGIKAIFFLCGHYLKETDLIGRMIAEGHTIGNHTDKHKDLPTLSREGIEKDIMTFQNDFIAKYPEAKPPVWFRPPQGRIDEKTLKVAKENNLRTTMWSIAIKDWGKAPIDAQKSAEKIAGRAHPGAVILMHITNAGTPKMLDLLIPMLVAQGYEIGSPDIL
ncbi:MAG: polysaccharide deacetylase family protein [Christensenellaceae bacterium]|jgi:peptidoglycan-N-acetylmuramic acid deacetylase|nr:polysaccharide deacetylase family protein [Christensenellaceae bacterium]